MTILPRCHRCGNPLACYRGERYCPDCTSYVPAAEQPRPAHRSPSQQASNDPEGYNEQMDSTGDSHE
jgi:uncharacterized Zn finger protein (UPF0148 family)